MIGLRPKSTGETLRVLCCGAHSDDIEIGCGGTILYLRESCPNIEFQWVVFNAVGVREGEARRAASLFAGSALREMTLKSFPDGFMPYVGGDVKTVFEQLKQSPSPDLVLCPWSGDAHQDHRLVSELTRNTFRDHLILEYEIPKYDGDMGRPNVFVHLQPSQFRKKVANIFAAFPSQHSKAWFDESTFLSLMRLRGMECNAPSGYAEAFHCHKILLA